MVKAYPRGLHHLEVEAPVHGVQGRTSERSLCHWPCDPKGHGTPYVPSLSFSSWPLGEPSVPPCSRYHEYPAPQQRPK